MGEMRRTGDDPAYDYELAVVPYIVFGLILACSCVGVLSYLGLVG